MAIFAMCCLLAYSVYGLPYDGEGIEHLIKDSDSSFSPRSTGTPGLNDFTEQRDSNDGLKRRTLSGVDKTTPVSWTDDLNTYELVIDVTKCYDARRDTIVGDYTFVNGTKGEQVTINDLLVDQFNLKHDAEDFTRAHVSHLRLNVQAGQSEANALLAPPDHRDELRHLLQLRLEMAHSAKLVGKFVASLIPFAGLGYFMGFVIVKGLKNLNSTDDPKFPIAVQIAVAGAAFLTALAVKLDDYTSSLAGNEPFFSDSELHALMIFAVWFRNVLARCKRYVFGGLTGVINRFWATRLPGDELPVLDAPPPSAPVDPNLPQIAAQPQINAVALAQAAAQGGDMQC